MPTSENLVIVGENKVGKSNFIFALRLLLDPTLPERDRHLSLEHFWDGLGENKLGSNIEISIDLTDFTDDPRLIAHLSDCVIDPGPPMVARLTYLFRPKPELEGEPESLADYEYVVYGGNDPDVSAKHSLRRMLPVDVLEALRDAEGDLANWRRSPLRPLVEELIANLDTDDRTTFEEKINEAHAALAEVDDVDETATAITGRLVRIVGKQHANTVKLGFAPVGIDAVLKGLRLLIDEGNRDVSEASLGSANLIFLALKSLQLDRLVKERERDHTFLVVEEPEAHLHPHIQRLVYRYFLGGDANDDVPVTTILTTHSPHIASVAPVRSIILLRHDSANGDTKAVSTARTPLTDRDEDDLQRYVDVNRGELFFARGVILVEGDAEKYLIPEFAKELDIPLDALGISVCSVGGTNFAPYVKLLGPTGLAIPHVIITDRDPNGAAASRGRRRIEKLIGLIEPGVDYSGHTEARVLARGVHHGYFVNDTTLEVELFKLGSAEDFRTILTEELSMRQTTKDHLDEWVEDPDELDEDEFLKLVERVGKGRLAQRLADSAIADDCPEYIRLALERIKDAVT